MTTANNESKEALFEEKVASGDLAAMARYLAAAIQGEHSAEELMRRYDLVWNADHGYDAMVLRKLATTAAAAKEFARTEAIAMDLFDSMYLADSYHCALAMIKYGGPVQEEIANKILFRLDQRGHIPSQYTLRRNSLESRKFPGNIAFLFFRISKVIQAGIILAKNPKDPRAEM